MLLGIAALILGIIALRIPVRRGMAITGIATGALSVPVAFIGLLLLTILLPALGAARAAAREAMTHLRALESCVAIYMAANSDNISVRVPTVVPAPMAIDLTDPRRGPSAAPSPTGIYAAGDFFYVGAGLRANLPSTSQLIVFYDQPGMGPHRLVVFADGHIEKFDPGSPALQTIIDQNNIIRARLSLPALPADIAGPPAALPASMP